MTQHIRNVLRFFTALQPILYIYSLKRNKVKKILGSAYSVEMILIETQM